MADWNNPDAAPEEDENTGAVAPEGGDAAPAGDDMAAPAGDTAAPAGDMAGTEHPDVDSPEHDQWHQENPEAPGHGDDMGGDDEGSAPEQPAA